MYLLCHELGLDFKKGTNEMDQHRDDMQPQRMPDFTMIDDITNVNVPSIVLDAMDAYLEHRIIEEIEEKSLHKRTAKEFRKLAVKLDSISEVLSGMLSVIGPVLVAWAIAIAWLATEHVNSAVILLAFLLPIGIGIFLLLLSIKWEFPLSIMQDMRFSFIVPNSMGPLVGGFITAGLLCGSSSYIGLQRQETKLITFNSAKNALMTRSIITMKDLQESEKLDSISTRTTTVQISENSFMTIKTERHPETKTIKHKIEDGDVFPGELEASVGDKAGSLTWIEDGKRIQQTQFYVCRVENTNGVIVVEALGTTSSSQGTPAPPAGMSDNQTVNLLINGNYFRLSAREGLLDPADLKNGENILLVFSPSDRTAISIEQL